ncbi:hypothetical protein LU646_14630 [Pseudomonas alloputida]|uniref:hypothetical protein n=1 Tax=Pseudomonas alloputida TaxID=1940621 RepID=UPI001E524EE7|nr:hypothetical protein [Pseudomonas alloputida]MCE1059114.1 hypothetical protein [Pseudomonas alloputida]
MQTTNLSVDFGGRALIGYEFAELPLGAALLAACQQIDAAADVARRNVLGDSLRALEYQTAEAEARVFAQAGYTGEAPPTVQAWMDAADLDAQAATDIILQEAAAWKGALYKIRAARLKGKQDVLKRTTHEAAEAVADEAINAIHASIQGVGNAN